MSELSLPATILVAWTLAAILLVGMGVSVYRGLGLGDSRVDDLVSAFWTGWALNIAVLQLWHLWAPVGPTALTAHTVVAAVGLSRYGRLCLGLVRKAVERRPVVVSVFVCAVGWAALLAAQPLRGGDAGRYHLSSIRWNIECPVVPGLGNLHGRLAFNSSWFLWVALLSSGPLEGLGHHLALGPLFIAVLTEMGLAARRVVWLGGRGAPENGAEIGDLFLMLLLPATLWRLAWSGLATTSTDEPVFILQILCLLNLLRLAQIAPGDAQRLYGRLIGLTLLAATGIAIKLSFAVYGIATMVIATWLAAAHEGHGRSGLKRVALVAAGTVVVVLVPWVARGAITSGYPVYPSTFMPLPVDWRIPEASVRSEAESIVGWARNPGSRYREAVRNWSWLGPWFSQTWRTYTQPLAVATVAAAVALLFRRHRGERLPGTRLWLVLAPAYAAVPAWFFGAPDPRFAGALFWIVGGGSIALALPARALGLKSRLLAAVVAIAMVPELRYLGALARDPLAMLAGPFAGVDDVPRAALRMVFTETSLGLYVPVEGDEVWDAPLPATPYPRKDLRLRCESDLCCGFTVEPPRRALARDAPK